MGPASAAQLPTKPTRFLVSWTSHEFPSDSYRPPFSKWPTRPVDKSGITRSSASAPSTHICLYLWSMEKVIFA
jgi:hypothetical protein